MLLSVIIPIRNEIKYIKESFFSIMESTMLIESEIFFVDGQSTDGTYEWLKNAITSYENCQLRINKDKIVSFGFNSVFNETKGKYISRIDGHTIYPKTYFRDAINILKNKDADVVGGPANHIGKTWKGNVIANCMMNPFGVGNSKFRILKMETYVDTVPFPIYKRSVLEHIGLYDEELIKNQDDELNYRCRANGYKILMSPRLMTNYMVRERLIALWKQYFFYGIFKPLVFRKVKHGFQFYHLIPAIHTFFSLISIILTFFNPYFFLYFTIYLIFDIIFSIIYSNSIKNFLFSLLVYPCLHYSYGSGMHMGYIKRLMKSLTR